MDEQDFDKLMKLVEGYYEGRFPRPLPRTLDELDKNVVYGVHRATDAPTGWSYVTFYPTGAMEIEYPYIFKVGVVVMQEAADFLIAAGYRQYVRKLDSGDVELLEFNDPREIRRLQREAGYVRATEDER